MPEIRSGGFCVMGCGRKGTHRQHMYCEWCYNTMRRGGFDKKPYRVRVRATRDASGKVIRKSYTRTQWKSTRTPDTFIPLKVARQETDHRPRCVEPGCDNLRRHNKSGKCDAHDAKAVARVKRYQADGKIKQSNAAYKSKLRGGQSGGNRQGAGTLWQGATRWIRFPVPPRQTKSKREEDGNPPTSGVGKTGFDSQAFDATSGAQIKRYFSL